MREAGDGHDGTWVAHPGLVDLAKAAFDAKMPGPNQIARRRDDVQATSKDLLTVPTGEITERGLWSEHRRGHSIHGGMVGGQRLRPPLQPHGGRGDGGDFPRKSGSGFIRPRACLPTGER